MADVSKIEIESGTYDVKDSIARQYLQNRIINVLDYGAKGDGVTDDYSAFIKSLNACDNGGIIVVPNGTYYLGADPITNTKKYVNWIISNGSTFTGAGVGTPSSGGGKFDSTYISNPWLITSGLYAQLDLNNITCPSGGAINGNSLELVDLTDSSGHKWVNLEYRGANTGTSENTQQHVELLNQVLNITGKKGIVQEIDLNTYKKISEFCVGLFITGGGDVKTDCTAIDITRDSSATAWVNGISVGQADTGLYIKSTVNHGLKVGDVSRISSKAGVSILQNGNNEDGLVLQRYTDSSPSGNLLVCWNKAGNSELFAVGIDGSIRANAINLREDYIKRKTVTIESITGDKEYTYNYTPDSGYKGLCVVETCTLGFVASVNINNFTSSVVTYYVNGSGSGSVRFTILEIKTNL